MANLVLNKIFFKIINPIVSVWISTEDFVGASKKKTALFKGIVNSELIEANAFFIYLFNGSKQLLFMPLIS